MKFRKKTQPLYDAMQFKGVQNYYESLEFIGREKADKTDPEESIVVPLADLRPRAKAGDWIVQLHPGSRHFRIYTDEEFRAEYEAVEAN